MRAFGLIALLGLACLPGRRARAEEVNFWPFKVLRVETGAATHGPTITSSGSFGPLIFDQVSSTGAESGGLRPFLVSWKNPAAGEAETDFLYPLLTHRETTTDHRWSLLELINFVGPRDPHAPGERTLDVWPFYFSRSTGDPATSYHAVFPLYGSVQDFLGYERLSWALFPLYGRLENKGVVTTATPWPFIRTVSGDGNRGFSLWPLFGWQAKPRVYRNEFYLWPLIYRNEKNLAEAKPDVSEGFLPFYTRDEGRGYRSETFVWPFFGYTHRRTPERYDEIRWFWPLLVQGRGDRRYVNRWAPLYTHSVVKGDDKHWVLWPLFRQERWTDAGLAETKTQLLYFVYWSLHERSVAHPAAPAAQKTHLWPLFSYWDNGAGHRQLQVLSPLEVFFQYNESVRRSYSPLFAIYRYDRRAPDEVRWSLLWDAVTWRREPGRREFHLGPLLSVKRGPEGARIAVGGGLLGLRRPAGGSWKPFLFDFSPKPRKEPQPGGPP